ncbi:DUF3836 domain-containing protein [Bacteroides sp. UBA939]|uniref:DUF3836 domain-containing protein n=1 Tax=Bacteroides sp. UBA939 TaxID=1946092 RepID=UPI0025B7C800|nr:DUF3836 domain-containing protein [Bacteroides sp. UBA939]
MRTKGLLRTIAMMAIMVACVSNSEVKAQGEFITNQVMNGELVESQTIFKKDGSYLLNHLRYVFAYDNENRMISKEAFKWDSAKSKWVPHFKMTYQYGDKEITLTHALWNESHKAYDKNMQKSVYELNEQNMPTASKTYKQGKTNDSDWT